MSRVSCLLLVCVVVLASFTAVLADVPGDEITSLPGWTGKLPSRHYSGYFSTAVDGTSAGMLHYWLTLSESNPKTDPLVLWLQGGPGCSSLFGLFYEMGQIHFASDPAPGEQAQLVYNNQSWTRSANMIWLEQPIGVGFSYCANSTADCSGSDFGTDAYHFFVNFFAAYPELSKNDFMITGESYAGVYVPYVADAILTGNAAGKNPTINLKSLAIGNGLGGDDDQDETTRRESDFWYGHASFSYQKQQAIEAACGYNGSISNACEAAIGDAEQGIGYFYIYDIYDTCPHDLLFRVKDLTDEQRRQAGQGLDLFAPVRQSRTLKELGFVCILESTSSAYLNTPAVQQAAHVSIANVSTWGPCGNGAASQGERWVAQHRAAMAARGLLQPNNDLGDLYKKLIPQLPILIYSGDVDQCVPYYYSDSWVRLLGFPQTESWRAWSYGGDDNVQTGGYVTSYGNANGLTFLTVRDSGHMVS